MKQTPVLCSSSAVEEDNQKPDSERDADDTVSLQEELNINLSSSFKRHKTITQSFSSVKSHAFGGRKYTKITNAILFMICHDYQPVNIVENEGFIELMHTVCDFYKLPSRKTVATLIDNKYNVLAAMLKEKIREAHSLTLTCDI